MNGGRGSFSQEAWDLGHAFNSSLLLCVLRYCKQRMDRRLELTRHKWWQVVRIGRLNTKFGDREIVAKVDRLVCITILAGHPCIVSYLLFFFRHCLVWLPKVDE